MASRPHIGLAFKRMHEARALNAYLIAQLDRSRAGTDVPLDSGVTLKEGGQGPPQTPAGGAREARSFSKERLESLGSRAKRAIMRERARQNKTYAGKKGRAS